MTGAGPFGLGGAGLGGSGMGEWMIDTFIYTSLLMALVLMLRRPVTEHFGARVAYALWALPLLRFIMPPIVLPAWMAPTEPAVATAAPAASEPLLVFLSEPADAAAVGGAATSPDIGIGAIDLLLPLWTAGALVFIGLRVREYVRMRRTLLADARPMGDAGDVRLVETPAVSAPVAFGIRDKVVALPPDFMALLDVKARDMAIAHELEHHRGHDLLANIAAQPLLALHWFNPLAWWGWRAMRRDQEAACDARVVAGRARSDRAAYAEVIAGFAAGEHLALAAPMACPVLGEKSIIHRLRSLTMNEHSNARRRIGIAAITTTALALPLTASISYAQEEAPQADDEFAVDMALAPQDRHGSEEDTYEVSTSEDGEVHRHVVTRRVEGEEGGEGERVVIRHRMNHGEGEHAMSAEDRAEMERELAEMRRDLEDFDGEFRHEMEIALAEAHRAGHDARIRVVVSDSEAQGAECDGNESVVERELEDGRRMMMVCRNVINANAIEGMREALDDIRNDSDIPDEMRERITRELQRSIERMQSRHQGAMRMEMKLQRQAGSGRVAVANVDGAVIAVSQSRQATRAPRAESTTAAVRWSAHSSPEVRILPLVYPVTGNRFDAPRDEECEENGTRV